MSTTLQPSTATAWLHYSLRASSDRAEPYIARRLESGDELCVSLSYVAGVLLEMASTHKYAEALRLLQSEDERPDPVTRKEIVAWHRATWSLSRRLDLTPERRLLMRQLADRVKAAHEGPARFVRKVPATSIGRRGLRLSILLWALDTLKRAAADADTVGEADRRATDDTLWWRWQWQLIDLLQDAIPDDALVALNEASIAERVSRFKRDALKPGREADLMASVLDVAIPEAIKRATALATDDGSTHPAARH